MLIQYYIYIQDHIVSHQYSVPQLIIQFFSFFSFLQPQPYESNIFSTWIEMLQSIEEKASNYASSLQTLETEILKDVKKLKACKQQRMKKFFDRVSFLQKEVEGSVSEVRSQFILRQQRDQVQSNEMAYQFITFCQIV